MGKDLPQHRQVDNMIVDENNERQWYTGCLPLGLADDKYWLSELQVYLRANFAEAFGATEDDIAAPMHGRNKPIALGQVGIRCMHCKCMCIFTLIIILFGVCLFVCLFLPLFGGHDEKLYSQIHFLPLFCLFYLIQMTIRQNEVNKPRRIPV
jgi:hypothetical protein